MKNSIHRFVTNDFTVRIAAVDATQVVQEMQSLQGTMPLASIGAGRAMVGALLMASQLKEGQEVGLHFKGNGPLGQIYAEASFEGQVRAYCPHPDYQAPDSEDVLNLRKAMGFGMLTVARHQPFQRQPFNGMVEMVSGEIGDDIAHYLHQSHQIRSVVSLGVYLDTYGKVVAAGGVLIEIMPGVDEAIVEKIEANVATQNISVSKILKDGGSVRDLVDPFLSGIPYLQIPHEHQVRYFCPCTQARVLRALSALGLDELQEMVDEKKVSDITCQVCGKKYQISTEELIELRESLRKAQMH